MCRTLLVFVLLLSGCARIPYGLIISAAADLQPAFNEIGSAYHNETGSSITFNYGSSGQLAQQIENGAGVDVFASANSQYINNLEQKGLIIPSTKSIYARGAIVIWVPNQSILDIKSINDLTQPDIKRISIANPDHAPYGLAAKQALISAGIFEKIQSKLVLAENIAQARQFAETGNADVAISALSLCITKADGRWNLIPQNLYQPINQTLAVMKNTKNEKSAKSFAEFLKSEQARHIMRKYGFTIPE